MSRSRPTPKVKVRRNKWATVTDTNGQPVMDPYYGTPKKAFVHQTTSFVKKSDRKQARAKSQFKRISHRNGRRVSKQALQSGSTLRNGKLSYRRPNTRLPAED